MKIEFGNKLDNLDYNDLVFYLSEIVLNKTDEEIEKKQNLINENKLLFNNLRKEIDLLKNSYNLTIKELAKEKQKERVLSLVTTLKKEGVVRANNKKKIIDLLKKIDSYNFDELRSLEEKLTLII